MSVSSAVIIRNAPFIDWLQSMSYKIQELSLGGILDQAIKLVKNHFGLLFGIVALVYIPFNLAAAGYLTSVLPPVPGIEASLEEQKAFQLAVADNLTITLAVGVFTALLILPLSNAAITHAVAKLYLGKPTSVMESISVGFGRIIPLFLTSILMGLAIMGGLILLIIPGILFAFWFSLSTHAVVLEKMSGTTALKRSKALMSGNIGTVFVMGILLGVMNWGVRTVVGLIGQPMAAMAIQVVLASIMTLLSTAALVVFYFSCRCKLENFDLEHLADSMGESTQLDNVTSQDQF